MRCSFLLIATLFLAVFGSAKAQEPAFPPGWLPVTEMKSTPAWGDVRDYEGEDAHVRIYFPDEDKPVRGVFLCTIFHSGDPREVADLWNFALVTYPYKFAYDLGQGDKRFGRQEDGHEQQDMRLLLRYLAAAGKATGHPELAEVPIVGWSGQNGSHLCGDLFKHAPNRILAWGDSFPNRLRQFPEMTAKVPFAFAWEISKKELREGVRKYRDDEVFPKDLSARANTYGHGHGIYSKFNYFLFYFDRCIQLRLKEEGHALKPAAREAGWVGNFDPITSWAPIASVASGDLDDAKYACWFPDKYCAWAWRAYHSSCTDLKITGPKLAYAKIDGQWGGKGACGVGYGGFLAAAEKHTFTAQVKGDYAKVVYHDGDKVLGEVDSAPWALEGVRLDKGLRVLFAVGVREDGTRAACRPAVVIVR